MPQPYLLDLIAQQSLLPHERVVCTESEHSNHAVQVVLAGDASYAGVWTGAMRMLGHFHRIHCSAERIASARKSSISGSFWKLHKALSTAGLYGHTVASGAKYLTHKLASVLCLAHQEHAVA